MVYNITIDLKKNEVRIDVFEQNPSKVLTESEQSPSIIDRIVEVGLLGLSSNFPRTLLGLYLDCLQTPRSPLGVRTEYVGECKVLPQPQRNERNKRNQITHTFKEMKEIKGEIHFFQCLGYIKMGPWDDPGPFETAW